MSTYPLTLSFSAPIPVARSRLTDFLYVVFHAAAVFTSSIARVYILYIIFLFPCVWGNIVDRHTLDRDGFESYWTFSSGMVVARYCRKNLFYAQYYARTEFLKNLKKLWVFENRKKKYLKERSYKYLQKVHGLKRLHPSWMVIKGRRYKNRLFVQIHSCQRSVSRRVCTPSNNFL